MRLTSTLQLIPLSLCCSASAFANTACVGTPAELQQALTVFASNGESDLIRVKEGVYPVQALLEYLSFESFAITIEGGYRDTVMLICGDHIKRPTHTILDGGDVGPVLQVRQGDIGGNLTMRDLTIQHGLADGEVAALTVGGNPTWTGKLTVERLIVRDNRAAMWSASFSAGVGQTRINDLAFYNNETSGVFSALIVSAGAGAAPVALTNLTVAGNRVFPASSGSVGMLALFGESAQYVLSNSLLWGNAGKDLRIESPLVNLVNNDIGLITGVPASNTGGISIDPRFLASNDYRLAGNSPARDAGINNPQGGLGFFDVNGAERLVFGTVDMGAYELQDGIFANSFE